MTEQAIILTVADNLELMCAVIEKAAMDKATFEVDEALATAFLSRKKHRDLRPNQPYVDMNIYQMSTFPNMLPTLLRPKPSGLQPSQLSVYEDFLRIPRAAPTTTATTPTMDRTTAHVDPGFQYNNYGSVNSPAKSIGIFDRSLMANQQQQQQQQQHEQLKNSIRRSDSNIVSDMDTLDLISPEITGSSLNTNTKRAKVIEELLETEKAYQKDMTLLKSIYYDGALNAGLSKPDVRHLFSNLNDIVEFEKTFVILLEHSCEQDSVGTCFRETASIL